MKCPRCESTSYRKNGRLKARQRYQCKICGRQFLEPLASQPPASFLDERWPTVRNEQNGQTNRVEPKNSLPSPQTASFTQELLQLFNSPEFLKSPAFQHIIQTLHGKQQTQISSDSPISILLLDAENLNDLDGDVESFLSDLSRYPLTVKLAFANWKKTGGDSELFQRGYQMIHVPLGKDSADAQMIAMGAAISQHYRHAKEVFVCSSDWLLTYLITELEHQGFLVYRVSKKHPKQLPKIITVEQMNTGEIKSYSLRENSEIPSPQELFDKIEALISETHDSLEERLKKLSKIHQLFELEKKLNYYQTDSSTPSSELNSTPVQSSSISEQILEVVSASDSIKNKVDLEMAIQSVLTACLNGSKAKTTILISELAIEFKKVYGESPKTLIKKLNLGSNLCKFLQKCERFAVSQNKNVYQVCLKNTSASAINSQEELEKSLIEILTKLEPKYLNSLVPLEVLSQQFQLDYKISLSNLLKELKIATKVLTFITSSDAFILKKQQNKHHVTLAKK
ncbi:transposase [Capilliphycus salinus ALCB114379]|uniref:transposase n=1 Tax=Capilliphycus salinus TaxID=2768948 RepID=UPI0039A544E2